MGSRTGELKPRRLASRRSVFAGIVRRAVTRLRPAGVVLAIATLLAASPYPTCLLRLFAGIPCPACGLTRAGISLMRGDIMQATRWHPLSPALAVLFVASVCVAFIGSDALWQRFARAASLFSAVALVVVWGLRFLGVFGGPVP